MAGRSLEVPEQVSVETATAFGVEARLRVLIDRGYRFIHVRDADGRLQTVVGIRPHHTVVDVVRISAEDSAVATRIPGTEADILQPSVVLWCRSGHAWTVLDDLLALPDGASHGDRPVRGCWVRSDRGRAKWMAATG